MTSLQRCQAVLRGKTPDRVPVVAQSFMMAARYIGYGIGEINQSAELLAKSQLELQRKIGYDGIVIDVDDASLAEACGATVIHRKEHVSVVDEKAPLVDDLRMIPELPIPDPATAGRLPVWLDTTRRIREAVGDRVFILGRADQGPFSLVSLLRGTENFMEDLLTEDPEVVHAAMEWSVRVCARFALAQLEAGAHATSMGDSMASPNLISPQMYRTFAHPYEKKIVREVQARGGIYSVHICGNTTAIISEVQGLDCDIFEMDWKVDFARARDIIPKRTVIMGNIDPSAVMLSGTADDVYKHSRQIVETAEGRGVFLSSGCALGANTPIDNLEAMMEAVK